MNIEQSDPWSGRQTGMKCRTCIWFVAKEQISAIKPDAPTMGGYPVVFVNDWCGDRRVDENKI